MCGIAGVFGREAGLPELEAIVGAQTHRGPDADRVHVDSDAEGFAGLGHNRLSIIDLSAAGAQPMSDPEGRWWVVFNGEIYNYRELRHELSDFGFRSETDTEVILAAYARWGTQCLDRFVGMFSFILWDRQEKALFAARDRFGKKPLYYHDLEAGGIMLASEIPALHAAGVPAEPDATAWATYLRHGLLDHEPRTFWHGVSPLPAGHLLEWRGGKKSIRRWYDLADQTTGALDQRPEAEIEGELLEVLTSSVSLRLRADVPIGVNLSGGLDSSLLLGLLHQAQGPDSNMTAFTFATGDERYDELPWARQMLARTQHPWEVCTLRPEEVPALAADIHRHQSEPMGGLPTIAYAKLFERARELGVIVLLDGQGMDEQWAGYDYYEEAAAGGSAAVVQGTRSPPVLPECLVDDFAALARPLSARTPYPDGLRNAQYRDACRTKIPRALRFNDRVSMRSSTELRSPFLDHRLFELSLRQRESLKIRDGVRKWLPRRLASGLAPSGLVEAPKRPLQTPQREWLRGPLREWADACVASALTGYGGSWLRADEVRSQWQRYQDGGNDNSYYVWQWISLGMAVQASQPAGLSATIR